MVGGAIVEEEVPGGIVAGCGERNEGGFGCGLEGSHESMQREFNYEGPMTWVLSRLDGGRKRRATKEIIATARSSASRAESRPLFGRFFCGQPPSQSSLQGI